MSLLLSVATRQQWCSIDIGILEQTREMYLEKFHPRAFCRSMVVHADHARAQLIDIQNKVVDDVLRRINVEELDAPLCVRVAQGTSG